MSIPTQHHAVPSLLRKIHYGLALALFATAIGSAGGYIALAFNIPQHVLPWVAMGSAVMIVILATLFAGNRR